MTQALLVSNAVLWMVVVLLGCVVAALARQIGVLHERVAPAGALMVGKGPAVGEPAPVVRVEDLAGTVRDVGGPGAGGRSTLRSEEHTSELQSHSDLVCRLLLEKKNMPSAAPSGPH